MNIILKDIAPDDWSLAIRAAKFLHDRSQSDAWLQYGEGDGAKEFYAKRNKASITVRALTSASGSDT